jgi:hypothetical protein
MSTPDTEYRWIGIDVSKDHLDVYDLKQQTATRYVNDGQGVEQLWQACSGDANCAVVCEASGGYETLMGRASGTRPTPWSTILEAIALPTFCGSALL